MLKAYDEDKDLYAVIGTAAFHTPYEENLEFNPITHKLQPDGKARRSKCKVILLGIMYSMSARSLAASLGCPLEEAEGIIDNFYKGFQGVKKFTDDSKAMLREKGYVTDMWGRRRRISDAMLPDFSITPFNNKTNSTFNPLIGAVPHEDKLLQTKIKNYQDKLSKAKWKKEIDIITAQAKKEGLSIRNNKGFISRASRQCLNARIQGTAASMTKRAMAAIHNDEELNKLGFRLLISVHDELIGEAPKENAQRASDRLSELMVAAAKPECCCKFKCDGYVLDRWYADEASAEVLKDYKKLLNNDVQNCSPETALTYIKEKYPMINPLNIEKMCNGTFDPNDCEII